MKAEKEKFESITLLSVVSIFIIPISISTVQGSDCWTYLWGTGSFPDAILYPGQSTTGYHIIRIWSPCFNAPATLNMEATGDFQNWVNFLGPTQFTLYATQWDDKLNRWWSEEHRTNFVVTVPIDTAPGRYSGSVRAWRRIGALWEAISVSSGITVLEIINRPPEADANGPYETYEGSAIIFDAGCSTDPDGDPLKYRWDFDGNQIWDTEWSMSPIVPHNYGDDWTGNAIVEVTDSKLTDTDTSNVIVYNVAPTVEAGPDQTVYSGDTVSFSGSFTDPGWLDTHRIEWDFGDGGSALSTLTPDHAYLRAGICIVKLIVTDDNGGVGSDTLIVTVKRIPVPIDIRPGSFPNSINPNCKGVIPVAILNDGAIDPALVDFNILEFGPGKAKPLHWSLEDVDDDGDIDLILQFKMLETGIDAADISATLNANLIDGRQITGEDSIMLVPPNNPNG